jgi:hypothetical protein
MERNSNMTTCQTQQERRGATTSRVAERLSDLLTHEIMTPRQALDFAIAIGDALALLHKSGKSHGGVSTENVWVHQNEAMLASRRPNAGVPMDDIVQFGALLRALLDVCQPQEGPLNTAMARIADCYVPSDPVQCVPEIRKAVAALKMLRVTGPRPGRRALTPLSHPLPGDRASVAAPPVHAPIEPCVPVVEALAPRVEAPTDLIRSCDLDAAVVSPALPAPSLPSHPSAPRRQVRVLLRVVPPAEEEVLRREVGRRSRTFWFVLVSAAGLASGFLGMLVYLIR